MAPLFLHVGTRCCVVSVLRTGICSDKKSSRNAFRNCVHYSFFLRAFFFLHSLRSSFLLYFFPLAFLPFTSVSLFPCLISSSFLSLLSSLLSFSCPSSLLCSFLIVSFLYLFLPSFPYIFTTSVFS